MCTDRASKGKDRISRTRALGDDENRVERDLLHRVHVLGNRGSRVPGADGAKCHLKGGRTTWMAEVQAGNAGEAS